MGYMSCNKNQVCVLMMNSPSIPEYGNFAAMVNYMYAAKHGYSFIVQKCPRTEDLGKEWMWDENNQYVFVWSKPVMFARYLEHFEYVFYIDSDAVFWDFEKPIEDMIKKFEEDPELCMVMAEDCSSSQKCYDKENVNAGVMLLKRSPTTSALLKEWIDAAETAECADWKTVHPREQQCLNILRQNRYSKQILKLPTSEMNGNDGKWVRHYMATEKDFRNDTLRDVFAKRAREVMAGSTGGEGSDLLATTPAPHQLPRTRTALILAVIAALLFLLGGAAFYYMRRAHVMRRM